MTSPAKELQKAVFAALSGSAPLAGFIGNRIHDHAPANVVFPYLTFGRTAVYDWETATESGSEHIFTVHVWSRARGKSQTLDIMQGARAALHDAALSLDGHRLVNLRLEFEEARFNEDQDVYQGILRFRAVTEPVD